MEIQRLRRAVKENHSVRLLLDLLAAREDGMETTVDWLVATFRQKEIALERAEIIKTLRYLASLGCGKLISGRHTKPARMSWALDVRALVRLALEQGNDRSANQHAATEGEGYAVLWAAHLAEIEALSEPCP